MTKAIAVLQARTSSSRLPAKVLLPICGLPVVVLAAKRAGNTGIPVVVATSEDRTDDGLVALLKAHGIAYFRGSLEDTLGRFVGALDGLSDHTLVFRLTADNTFPDGRLLDEISRDFLNRNLSYIICGGDRSGLPYGVSVELTRIECIREADRDSTTIYDREHVTPYIKRKYGEEVFDNYERMNKSNYRATIDSIDDYYALSEVFARAIDPINEDVFSLIKRLDGAYLQPFLPAKAERFVLGAAQLGSAYGIANRFGKPSAKEAEMLVKTAIANGVAWIDTARAYGESEAVLGRALENWRERSRVVTKLSPLTSLEKSATQCEVRASVEASVYDSCRHLRMPVLDTLLLHRATHLSAWNHAAWTKLKELRDGGIIGHLGVSVQTATEAEAALDDQDVSVIQLPFNILDWRWTNIATKIETVKKHRTLTIHARSALLQGLLTSSERGHWQRAYVQKPEEFCIWLESGRMKYGYQSIAQFCLAYANSQNWIDGIVVGVETNSQLRENLSVFSGPRLSPSILNEIAATRPLVGAETLDPAGWRPS